MTAIIYWTVILGMVQAQDNSLGSIGGIIQINTNSNVVVLTDSVLISMLYNTNEVEYMWNNFIEKGESVSASLGHNNCVEQILNNSRASRFKIKEFLNARRHNLHIYSRFNYI